MAAEVVPLFEVKDGVSGSTDEEELMRLIEALCRRYGVIGLHIRDSRRMPAVLGWPDWEIWGRNGPILREVKTRTGKLSKVQIVVLERLRKWGFNVSVWTPADYVSGKIEREIAAVAGTSFAAFSTGWVAVEAA